MTEIPAAADEPDTGLQTRHVFLDTEVFRRRGHNLTVAPFPALEDHLGEKRLILHTTDITLREIQRQIRESAREVINHAKRLNRELASWGFKAPGHPFTPAAAGKDEQLADTAWGSFRTTLVRTWRAHEHQALAVSADAIFSAYFDRKPPFDKELKEFPDAFVIAALEAWCAKRAQGMYVVTGDNAMRRAAQEAPHLHPLNSLEELLELVTAAQTPTAVSTANELVRRQEFRDELQGYVDAGLEGLGLIYGGELPEGEAYGAELADDIKIDSYSIISSRNGSLEILFKIKAPLLVDISFEDRSSAMYDKEDDVYFGAEIEDTKIEAEATLRVLAEVDPENGDILHASVLPDDLHVSEPADDDGWR